MEILIPLKVKSTVIFIILFVFYSLASVDAQSVKLKVEYNDTTGASVNLDNRLDRTYRDSLELKSRLREAILQLRQNGYLTASFDSLEFDEQYATVTFYPGKKFKWGRIKTVNFPDNFEYKKRKFYFEKSASVDLSAFLAYQDYMLNFLRNRGYPFANLLLKNVSFHGDTVFADLKVKSGSRYHLDTIFIKGKNPVHKSYLYKKLGISPGMLYDASLLSSISNKIHKIPFLAEVKPSEIEFSENNRANLYLYLNDAQSNRLSGVVGFLSDENQSFQLTGSLNLMLRNAFNRGEEFHLRWESFEEKTQQLNLDLFYPYLFFNSIGMDLEGSLLKQDTSYLTTNFRLSFPFHLNSDNIFELYWRYQGSSVISEFEPNESSIQDFRKSLYGIGFIHNTLDYELNPSAGFYLEARSSLGNRKNNDIRSVHLETELQLAYYMPLFNSFVLKPSLHSAYMKSWSNDKSNLNLSENELYRIGGNKFLRGFQERQFYASFYSVTSVELRYLLGANSNVHLFFDGAYYRNSMTNRINEDFPLGIGLGANLDTGSGIISLSYALGKTSEQPFEIKNAMVHVGYINKF
jgi:outer membrane protein assembly factor BamA